MLNVLVHLAFALTLTQTSQAYELNPHFEQALKSEAQDLQRIRSGILYLQEQQAKESGHVLRGTHAKGICAKGELNVLDLDPSSPLKQGLFSTPGHYLTTLRFANAAGKIQADQEPDVRAVSLRVQAPVALSNPQGQIDFAMNNAPTFPINDAHVFGSLMVLAKEGVLSGAFELGFRDTWLAKQAVSLGAEQQTPAKVAYQKMNYWSDVPFALGPNQAVKYKLAPCAKNLAENLTSDPDTLSLELKRHLHADSPMSCFDLQVQVLNESAMTDAAGKNQSAVAWVENSTWEWSESQAPFTTVAQLTLMKDSDLTAADCEALRIDVTKNTSEIHHGLGSINRARASGESASSQNR